MTVKKVISGGQCGADVAGLRAAKALGILTGGSMPLGWRTLDGPRPTYAADFGLTEHPSPQYPPRTEMNVLASDGTIRFARDFRSRGELCTLKFLRKHRRPYYDVGIDAPPNPALVREWLEHERIETLNVAGNSEHTASGIEAFVENYLKEVLSW